MTYLDNSPVKGRSSPWSDLGRRCSQKRHLQKRYWCFFTLAALFPFTMLRMVYLCNTSAINEQSSEINAVIMESEEPLQLKHRSIISSGSTESALDVKSSTSIGKVSRTSRRERVSIEETQPKEFGEENREESDLKTSQSQEKHSSRQSVGPQLNDPKLSFTLPKGNEELNSSALVSVEKQEERPTGEHSTFAGNTATAKESKPEESEFEEMHGTGRSPRKKGQEQLRLPADNENIGSMATVVDETQQQKQAERQDEKQDEKSNGGNPISAGKITDDGPNMEVEDHMNAAEELPPSKDVMHRQNEAEGKDLVAQKQGEESKGADESGEAQQHADSNEGPTERKGAESNPEEKRWKDDRQEAQREEVEKEAQEQKEQDERKIVEAVVEKREEEEVKDAEGIELEMMKEKQVQSSEREQNLENGDAVIEEVTDRIRGEQPEEATGECDLFEGDWVWDPEGPLYTNSTCFYMQLNQNCMGNGRPDTNYLHWKWKPRDCDLPRFDAKAFLEAFRGKAIGFAGDSLARNQMQSLLCMLSQIEIPKMIYQSPDDSAVRWLFEQQQVTLAAVWSPYLLKESDEGIMGFEKGQSVLYLDELDTAWTSLLKDLDIIVLSIGQWYFKGAMYVKQEEVVGCYYCPGFNFTQMRYEEAYQGAVRQVLEKVASEFTGIAIMSTFAVSHFEEGPWNNGGQCRREEPLDREEAVKFPGVRNDMHDIVMSEFNSIASDKSKLSENVKLEFLDVTKVSLTRADGHPGAYRHRNPYEGKDPNEWVPNDCLHWCLPGPVDTWNQLLVKIVHRHL